MALLSTKKKTEAVSKDVSVLATSVIKGPRITEKASILASKNVYTFNVATTATKSEIKKAIKAQYKVTPARVTIAKFPSIIELTRGKWGKIKGGKKAYVHLKKGDTIAIA